MEVVKEEPVQANKLKNSTIKSLLSYYAKLVNSDFDAEDMTVALAIVEDSFVVENAFKAYQKLEKNVLEKYQKMESEGKQLTNEDINKINDKLKALSEEFIVIEKALTKIPEKILKLVKFKPIELKALKEAGVI